MSTPHHPASKAPVIVGVDGSDTSLSAVDLAARMATLSRRPLRIIHAFIWPYFHVPLGPPQGGPPYGGLRHQAERIVDEGVARARAAAPDTTVTGDVITGSAAPVLLDVARTAALVVIGDRGLGGFTGLLIGSVAVHLAQYSPCPVLVARGLTDPAQPILLGVDGSPANDAAIGYAFEAAALHGVPLVALHAWKTPVSTGPGDILPMVDDSAQTAQAEQRVLAEALAGWQDKYPDVTVERRLVRGSPRKSLIEASGHAQLVVVGSRGLGGFTGLLLGSVSHAVLYHATCPVAVVPDTRLAHPGSAAEAINVEVEQ